MEKRPSIAILGGFAGQDLGRNTFPRTPAALSAYTAPEFDATAIHPAKLGHQETYRKIERGQPMVTGISIQTWQEYVDLPEIAAELKKKAPRTIIVVGGLYPGYYCQETLRIPGVDVVVRGWGESAWETITEALSDGHSLKTLSGYPGIYLSAESTPSGNELLQHTQPLPQKNIKQPLYTALAPSIQSYAKPDEPVEKLIERYFWPNVLTGIGCLYDCIFCISTLLHRLDNFGRNRVELRPPSLIAEEAKLLLELTQVSQIPIYLTNPDSFYDPQHFLEILNQLELQGIEKKVLVGLDVRVHNLYQAVINNPELLTRLEGKVHRIILAPESLHPGTQNIIGKYVDVSELRETIAICTEIKAMPMVQLVVGFPTDSDDTLQYTLEELIRLRDSSPCFILNVHRATPFPGTTLYNQAVAENLLNQKADIPSVTVGKALMGTQYLTPSQVTKWIQRMVNKFYTEEYLKRIHDETNPAFEKKAKYDLRRSLRGH